MKNIDFKKLLVFLGIVLAIGLVIFGIVKIAGNKKGANEEQKEILEDIGLKYIARLTEGYNSNYNGVDLLYGNDKEVTYEDLSVSSVLNTATRYIGEKEIDNAVPSVAVDKCREMIGPEAEEYAPYKGEAIRQAIKELFGVDFDNTSAVDEAGYGYNFYYIPDYDIYLKGKNIANFNYDYDFNLRFYTVKTAKIKKGDKLQIEYAVAYTMINDGQKRDFATDVKGENIVATLEKTETFPEDKVKEFDTYTITLKKDGDNYIFESFKKGSIK
jgi:hypothetical protein